LVIFVSHPLNIVSDTRALLHNYPFLSGGGEMGDLIRAFDWSATPLGGPSTWPAALRYPVSMLLNTAFPVLICWGDDYIQLYNDAFRPINGKTKHPQALGASARDTYAEIWDTIGPLFKQVMTGTPVGFSDLGVKLERNDYPEDCYFDFTYNPIYDDEGAVRGIRVICIETTAKVLALRQLDAVNHEMAATNEELNAANEELSSTNEELAATNEELLQTQELLTQTLESLTESEQRFRNLVRDADVGIVLLMGPEMRVGIANDAYARLLKRTAAELDGKPIFDFVPSEDESYFRPLIEGVRTSGEPAYLYETPYLVYKDGEAITGYLNIIYQPYHENNGRISGVMVLCQDVTAQVEATQRLKLANEELSAKESRLQMAIAATNLGTWEYNIVSGDLYWSPECRQIYGIGHGEVPTMASFEEHIHPADRSYVQTEIARCITVGSQSKYEITYRILRFDNNETRWIRVNGKIYEGVDGSAERFAGTVLDITELKRAEEESAKLAAIITSSDDAIISKTLDSVITSWNSSAQRIFGYTAEEMIGETIYKLIPADRQDEETEIIERLRKGEHVDHFETKRLTKDGRLIDVSLTISPVKDGQGQIIGASKIARDITERKLDEARKNDFIGMVSHELKTPLTSLNAILQLASSKLKDSGDTFLSGAMERANKQVKKMTAMINGFLNVSRLESGKIVLDRRDFDLFELLQEIVTESNLISPMHAIHLDECPGTWINADRDKVGSVITNLVSNAVKYSAKGQPVTLRCERKKESVVVSVRDQGMGIPPEDLPRVFDRYFRIESQETRQIAGFGIGLYLSAEIIHRHHGEIWAESELGKGSTFFFSLPLDSK